ncbi:MAG: signal peptide peptidase SppA [Nanoarchaeota archaeon]|nr:signal peptide peptidase SppA [Nanoarchaeota archaeon]
MKKTQSQIKQKYGWGFLIVLLITFGFLSMIFAGIVSLFVDDGISYPSGNIAMIPIKGIIISDPASGFISSAAASSTEIVKMIEKADKDTAIKGIIFEIDSPGGMVVPTDEIALAIKRSNKTTAAWIRSAGASGAYWIAASTDRIFVHRMSATGSIGVIGSYLQFSGLLEKYNVTYERLVSGKYKDMGSPYKDMTSDEREIFQNLIDKMRHFFIEEIAENRNLSYDYVENLATGQIYLGYEAKELGLIDEIGGKEEVKEYLKKELNLTKIDIAQYKKEKTLIDILSSVFNDNSFHIGRGIGSSIAAKSAEPDYPMIWW